MSASASLNDVAQRPRRSTRNSAAKASIQELRRPPLKRTRKPLETQAAVAAVNGSRSVDDDADDDGVSPSKRGRPMSGVAMGTGKNDQNEMDVQEGDLEQNEDQEMDVVEECPQSTFTPQPGIIHGAQGDVNLASSPFVVLGRRCQLGPAADKNSLETQTVKRSTKAPPVVAKSAAQSRPSQCRPDVSVQKTDIRTDMAEYKKKMSSKPEGSGLPNVARMNHQTPSTFAKNLAPRQRPIMKDPQQPKQLSQTGRKKKVTAACSRAPSRGLTWYIWRLVLLVLLSAAVLLAFRIIPVLQEGGDGAGAPPTSASLEAFTDMLSRLQTRFLSQRPEVWRRSRIHLERHLSTADPTQPVSLILTAGRRAEKTLECLAGGMASAFSEIFNASVLHIDGSSKANRGSDEVKLYLDSQLKAAFEGDKPAAVIHRLEELPSGSTLIFYRYCDHENAAYKRVFLLFTVLLPQEEVSGDLRAVEELVQEYLEEKLVHSDKPASFNEMDRDKYGGLWSRISHLVLPVVSEKEVEQSGC